MAHYLDRPSHHGVRLAHHCLIYIILDTTYLILGEWSLLLLKVPVMRLSLISPNRYYRSSMVHKCTSPCWDLNLPQLDLQVVEKQRRGYPTAWQSRVDTKNLCLYSPKPCVCFSVFIGLKTNNYAHTEGPGQATIVVWNVQQICSSGTLKRQTCQQSDRMMMTWLWDFVVWMNWMIPTEGLAKGGVPIQWH